MKTEITEKTTTIKIEDGNYSVVFTVDSDINKITGGKDMKAKITRKAITVRATKGNDYLELKFYNDGICAVYDSSFVSNKSIARWKLYIEMIQAIIKKYEKNR